MNNLTNTDISNKIRSLREIKDPCDRAVALAEFEPEYKQSQFFKATKRSLQSLYYEIAIEDLLSFRTILDNVQQFINGLDAEKLIAMLDEINVHSLATMKASLDELDTSGLADLLHGLKR